VFGKARTCRVQPDQKLTYLDNIRPPLVLGADTGDGHCLPQPLDESVLQVIDLLEVRVEMRHLVETVIQIGPVGVGYTFGDGMDKASRCCDKAGG
jgi:hypothetical protein